MAHIANNVVTRTEDQSVGKIPSSMDIFCNYVKDNESINYDDEDVKDATKALDILLKRFIKAMGEDYPEFHVEELRLCGSMAEQTRIKEPGIFLEFDYLAVMKTWPGCGELHVVSNPNCSASARIEFDVHDEESTPGKRDFLTIGVANTFMFHLLICIQKRCEKLMCPQSFKRVSGCCQSCRFCCVYIGNGRLSLAEACRLQGSSELPHYSRTLKFKWTKKRPEDSWESLHVDLNPVFIFEQSNLDSRLKQKPLFLIPKTVHTCSCGAHGVGYGEDNVLSLRISTHEEELNMIRNASFSHKVAFMAFKHLIYFLNYEMGDAYKFRNSKEDFLPRHINKYSLKNIFLDHLQKCRHKRQYTAGSCLQRMLGTLLRCHNRYSTPHFQLKYNTSCCSLFCSDVSGDIYLTEEETLGHHQEVGLILKAVFDLLTQPNIHGNFEDIKQDLQTFLFIFDACRIEIFDPLYFIVKGDRTKLFIPFVDPNKEHYLSAVEKLRQWDIFRKNLIPAKLSEFLRLRENISSSDAKQHYVEKFRLKKVAQKTVDWRRW